MAFKKLVILTDARAAARSSFVVSWPPLAPVARSCWRTWSSVISFRSRSGRIRIRDSGRKIEWIWRQVVEATPGRQPTFLIHDRDADYGGDFDERLAKLAITGVRTPARAPKANAIGERLVRTIRSECLDHVIVINEHHLQSIPAESAEYYNRDRPHRNLGLQTPLSMPDQSTGRVISRPVLGGLHHAYARAA